MADSGSLTEKLIDAFTGGIASLAIEAVMSYTSETTVAIKLRDRFKSDSDGEGKKLNLWLRTITIRVLSNVSMTKAQEKEVFSCLELQQTIKEWILNLPDNIVEEAKALNFVRWNFTHLSGQDMAKVLIAFAEAIKVSVPEFLSLDTQILRNEMDKIPQKILEGLSDDKGQLEAIDVLIKQGKVKTALTSAVTLSKSYVYNNSLRLSILEKIRICQARLPFSISSDDHLDTLHSIILQLTEQDKKERFRAVTCHLQNNHPKGLEHVKKALNLNPLHPSNYSLNCLFELFVNGEHAAKGILDNVPMDIIEKEYGEFANCYLLLLEHDKAEEYASLYLEKRPNDIQSLVIMAKAQLLRIEKSLSVSLYELDSNLLKELKQRLSRIQEVINEEDEKNLFDFLDMSGRVEVLQHNLHQAEIKYRKAYELDPTNQEVLKHLIWVLRNLKRNNELIDFVNRLDESDFSHQILKNLALIQNGNPDEALENTRTFLQTHSSNLSENEIIQMRELELRALIRLPNIGEAKKVDAEIQTHCANSSYACQIHADFLIELRDPKGAIECLRSALSIDSEMIDYYIVLTTLFRLLAQSEKQEDIDEAIQTGDSIFSSTSDIEDLTIYLRLLFNQKHFPKCIKLCREIESEQGLHENIKDVEATALFHLKEYEESTPIFQWLYRKDRYNIEALKKLCWNLFHLRNFSEIQNLLEIAEPILSTNIQFLSLCSHIFRAIHLEQLDEFSINKSFKFAKLAVEVSNESQEYIEFYLKLTFDFPNSSIRDNEYITFGQKLIHEYTNGKFPEGEVIKKLDVPTDPEELRNFFIENFSSEEMYPNNVRDLYNNTKLPLSFLARTRKEDIFKTWKVATSKQSNLKIWLSSSHINNFIDDDKVLNKKIDIIISLHSLFLLHKLNLLNEVFINSFNSISVTRSGWQDIYKIREDMVRSAQEGSKTLYIVQKNIMIDEVSPIVHQQTLQGIDEIINFINSNCKIIGQYTIEFNPNEDPRIERMLGIESAELIQSRNTKYVIFCEDQMIRKFSKEFSNKDSTFILPYLRKLKRESIIDNEQYNKYIQSILELNYDGALDEQPN